jgi:hypothetical protein
MEILSTPLLTPRVGGYTFPIYIYTSIIYVYIYIDASIVFIIYKYIYIFYIGVIEPTLWAQYGPDRVIA